MYLYELHSHTGESSKCGKCSAADMVRFYKDAGFAGVFITDHFLNGNTVVPADLPWQKRVDLFFKGYENAKEEGDKIGIDVFCGWEYCFGGTDFLTYGLDKKWLYENPHCLEVSVKEYCAMVHQSGGIIIHAHPFRESAKAYAIEMIRLMPRDVDAVESFNANMTDFQNGFASQYATAYNLREVMGTDNHRGQVKRAGAVCFKERLTSERDFAEKIKNGNYECKIVDFA